MLSTVDLKMTKTGSLFLRRENRHVNRHSQFCEVNSTRKGDKSYHVSKGQRVSPSSARARMFTVTTGIGTSQIVSDPNVTSFFFISGNSEWSQFLQGNWPHRKEEAGT